jgi:hypothetical protein
MVTAKAPVPTASMRRSNMADIDPKVRCRRSNDAASLEKARDLYKIETELRLTAYKIRKDCRAVPRGGFSRKQISPRAPAHRAR